MEATSYSTQFASIYSLIIYNYVQYLRTSVCQSSQFNVSMRADGTEALDSIGAVMLLALQTLVVRLQAV